MRGYIVLILLSCFVLVLGWHDITSIFQDIGRHITLGKLIWETGSIPSTNYFSYTQPDFPFLNHHWLGEVLLYGAYSIVGLQGLVILKALLLAVAFGLALAAFYKPENIIWNCLIGLVSIFMLIERMDVRPEIVSFLFVSIYLFVVFRVERYPRLLWLLPFIQIIWVNTHIYFFMGPLIFGAFLVQQYLRDRRWPDRRQLLFGLAIAVSNLINPFGIQGAFYPLFILGNYGYTIVENQGPLFLRAYGLSQFTTNTFFVGIAVVSLSFMLNYRRLRANIGYMVLVGITIILSFKMIRNFPLFALVLVPVSLKNFYESGIGQASPLHEKKFAFAIVPVILMLMWSVATNQVYALTGLHRQFGLGAPAVSTRAIEFIRKTHLQGPIFNNFDVGSYLIWQLPEEKVFIDGRPEAYPADFIQNVYIKMQDDPKVWQEYSETYKIRYVVWNYHDITPWSQKFLAFMAQNRAWPQIYHDDTIVIFAKNLKR